MKKYTLVIMAFAIVALLGVGTVSALGIGLGPGLTDEEKAERDANKEAMRNAIETGDYAEWEGLMQERLAMMEDRINEETFNAIVEKHGEMEEFHAAVLELKDSGDFSREAMEALREEYGIEGKGPKGEGFKKGFKMGSRTGEGRADCPLAE
jgi:hypothetical protein